MKAVFRIVRIGISREVGTGVLCIVHIVSNFRIKQRGKIATYYLPFFFTKINKFINIIVLNLKFRLQSNGNQILTQSRIFLCRFSMHYFIPESTQIDEGFHFLSSKEVFSIFIHIEVCINILSISGGYRTDREPLIDVSRWNSKSGNEQCYLFYLKDDLIKRQKNLHGG